MSHHAYVTQTGSENPRPGGNFASRRIFVSEDLLEIRAAFGTDKQMVTWDVGVPMHGDRPVLDSRYIRDGQIRKTRAHLSVSTEADGLVIALTNHHPSRHDTGRLPLKPPVIGDLSQGVFAAQTDHNEYDALWLALHTDGRLGFYGVDEAGNTQLLYEGNNPGDDDYSHCITFIERMLLIPRADGVPRDTVKTGPPLAPIDF